MPHSKKGNTVLIARQPHTSLQRELCVMMYVTNFYKNHVRVTIAFCVVRSAVWQTRNDVAL